MNAAIEAARAGEAGESIDRLVPQIRRTEEPASMSEELNGHAEQLQTTVPVRF